ncbi:hypothetical protein [Gimesia maris]|jgi:hypothetical protein|nr:hypothetical protein [Gimesia maris]EDL57321.1 hypothetical protein PM8797T_30686 [Gimesia maris DSM 8797]|tara:strand:- start:18117 stop:18239 length:123 start_codon:yes stop_codon:yes gene_type:complete
MTQVDDCQEAGEDMANTSGNDLFYQIEFQKDVKYQGTGFG